MLQETTEVEKFIELANAKSKKHYQNSLNSRKWKNLMDFTSAFLSASASLSLPILAVTGSNPISIAIVGNSFVFFNVIVNTLKNVYGFVTLEFIHGHLSSEFNDIENEFRTFQRRQSNIESRHFNDDDLEKLIIKFQGICSRSNVQNIKECKICCCCYY